MASLVAFAVSELSDFAVYAPLRKRSRSMAILASGIVGSIVDSALFLYLAFGSLAYVEGQIVGKLAMTVLVVLFLPTVKKGIYYDT